MPAVMVVCLETHTNTSSWQSDKIQAIPGIGSWVTSLGSYVTARLLHLTIKSARLVTVGKCVIGPEDRSTIVPLCWLHRLQSVPTSAPSTDTLHHTAGPHQG